ncbi:MAG: ATP12 family protein [Pseudomonadota bacterium]
MRDILGERDDAIPDRPTRVAEPSRESQLPKRFYETAGVLEDGGVYAVVLDGRSVRTPGKAKLVFQSGIVAQAVSDEWAAQSARIDPMTMPLTRLANTAVDGVATDPQAVKEDIIRYAGTDLLCYRADSPDALVQRQRERWDPVLDWAQTALSVRLILAEGVMHVAQPPESIAAFGFHVNAVEDAMELAALHVMTSLTGSAVLAMAVYKGELSGDAAWALAHLDEDWNIEQWGTDEEAEARRANRHKDMMAASLVVSAGE